MPGLKAQLTFDSEEARVIIEKNTKINIGGYPCQVVGRGGALRGENVLLFHLSYELDNEAVKVALQHFGPVHSAPPASPAYFYSYRDAHCSHDSRGAYP